MGFGRRTFLQLAGVGAVGLTGHDWSRLRLDGRLVLPGDADYDRVRLPFNLVYSGNKPAAVALCAGEADVARCLEFAARNRIPVAARGGKHSYAGYSTPADGLVVDLSALNRAQVSGDRVVVGGGMRLRELYEELGAAGRLLPAGTCATVGIGGLALGGGISVVGRRHGLTCDRLRAARVVTPDGVVRRVAADADEDLFWALRGGGGGNFGVVTSFEFETSPAGDLVVFSLSFPAGSAVDVLGAWQEWFASAPDELWTACEVRAGSPTPVSIAGTWSGPETGLTPWLNRLAARVRPTRRQVRVLSHLVAMRYFAGCEVSCPPVRGASFVASSRFLAKPADPAKVVALLTGKRAGWAQFDSFGGTIGRVPVTATAFPHRDAFASMQAYVDVGLVDQAEARRTVAALRDGIGGGTGYVNYIDPDMPDWATSYYGPNLPRLREVAARYDPDRVLAFAQGVR
ncbi:FAD-binding oxidoreductase [Saccharothrix violaceirubra]|uniref:FAD/FMN-containing dehydrogenase n=1 Tax=Saccharothrix violaceirubra TaxID=413306 RepID=A0A7W7WW23_9PSEU|nr:FAD-binding oxidoreductase [Saccharothrix violaceirubra]MBB4965522.1 FAD/FMN-containing dehydrogenase [Saccharothrix violaceirubra]